jgi:hypothetical protein
MMKCQLRDINGVLCGSDLLFVVKFYSVMPANRCPRFTLVLLAVLAGCGPSGPEVAPVSGRVTLDGQPLASADVSFQPDGAQRASSGRTNADGRYQLMYKRGQPGALVGEHTVRITVSREIVRNPPQIPARYDTQSERGEVRRRERVRLRARERCEVTWPYASRLTSFGTSCGQLASSSSLQPPGN